MTATPPRWSSVSLGDICEFKYGKSLPAGSRDGGPFSVYGSNGPVGGHSSALTDGTAIIIGRKGSFGEVHYSSEACWPIDTTYFIDRGATSVDLKWLSHLLPTLGLTKMNRAAAIPGLNRDDAYAKRVMLPPIAQQKRIAAVLDQVETLRAKRREAIALLDDLVRSTFLDMFGTLQQDWRKVHVADLAVSEKGGMRTGPFGSQLLREEFTDEGISVLGIDNAVKNEFRWGERRYISEEKYQELSRYTVHPGDLLITIMGTCGRSAVVPDDIPVSINTKHLCCITLDRTKCLPEFLHSYFLEHPESRSYLSKVAKGAIMSGLNMGLIKALPVRLPPLEVQQKYVRRVAGIRKSRMLHEKYLATLDELSESLQRRAFAGRLWDHEAA
ncbi:restriction endonuclease subunit S [Streptomyces sp. NPDC051658]|uniref:restriction endonuclease subunit S n=1 Tax=Streptomyces sp. NPDC051658 TaxID=3365667 RepID=UPI00378A5961